MEEIKLDLNENGQGAFYVSLDGEQLGEMAVSIADSTLTVYHTEVSPKAEGKGFAKKLLNAMVEHARNKKLKVLPLCPFVHAQFKRHPELYTDLWNNDNKKQELT